MTLKCILVIVLYHPVTNNARKKANTTYGDYKMISTIIRTIILYVTVTIAIRIMGKRQIGDLQPNELVITLLISEIAAIPLQDNEQPVLVGVSAILVLIFLEILMSVLSMKSFFVRKMLNGKSVVIIKNGTIDQKAMRDVRMTVIDLIELLRSKDVFDLSDVAFAVLEVNGSLSILLKKDAQTITAKDLHLSAEDDMLPLPVISDGKIVHESLKALQTNKDNLQKILKPRDLKIDDIFLMTLDRDGNHSIHKKDLGI